MPSAIQKLSFAILMSLTLSVLMSGWVTFINLGITSDFVSRWMHAFVLAWPAAFIISFTLGGKVKVISDKLSRAIEARHAAGKEKQR
ncbi:DUF2798 domain-containing protein [Alteromonas sp. CYL-A6]|uniref:DUF2798 domain-containing protein n=1 Tax=Alteromonas nitratireducens TaxID=3390813 RepID=UPI0034BE3F06